MPFVRRFIVWTLRALSRWSTAGLARWDPAACRQPAPVEGAEDVLPHLVAMLRRELGPTLAEGAIGDLEARAAVGLRTYGRSLQTRNGRDPLIDLSQELYDASAYAVQVLVEDGERLPWHDQSAIHRQAVHGAALARQLVMLAEQRAR
jgi:hypothetical protein